MTADLSRRLYVVLDKVGASKRMRRQCITTAKTLEVFRTITMTSSHNERIGVYYIGSTYEGSVTPGLMSDTDVLYCNEKMPIVLEARAGEIGNAFLLITDETTCPGYVKLQRVKNGFPLNIYISDGAEHCRADRAGKYCLSNSPTEMRCNSNQGPSLSYCSGPEGAATDIIGAYILREIPDFCKRDFERQRKYGWPTEDQLREMSKLECHAVAISNNSSEEKDIEWRLSFNLAERYLMTHLNMVQHKVYILLKLITKRLMGDGGDGNKISSYHCKTCILHMVENTPSRIWKPDNLVNCFLLCLSVLLRWLQARFCPDYFIPRRNLFWDIHSRRTQVALVGKLRSLLDQGQLLFLRLQTDNIGPMLQGEGLYTEIAVAEAAVMEAKTKWNMLNACSGKFLLMAKPYGPENLIQMLNSMTRFEAAIDRKEKDKRNAIAYIKPWIHLHLALSLASHFCSRRPALSTVYKSIQTIDDHLDKARGADLVASAFGKATILLKFKKYEACLRLMQLVEEKLTLNVLTRCTCHPGNRQSTFSKQQLLRTTGMSIKTMLMTSVASCVIFLPSEKNIIPEPLKYEMERSSGEASKHLNFWFEWAVVDARVFLFFMQYLVNSRLQRSAGKKAATDNLNGIISIDVNLGHKETAYNLLGWIYRQENRLDKARQCFMKSLEIRPTHNAAKWHLRHLQ